MTTQEYHPLNLLEKFFLEPKKFSEVDTMFLNDHLKGCALCKEAYDAHKSFYEKLEEEMGKPPTERDIEFAKRIARRE